MIHYYSYYSVGGYKNMYLGNSGMSVSKAYYFPLLSYEKSQAEKNNDADLMVKVKRQEQFPAIHILSQENYYGLPQTAEPLVTHGGFSLIYTHLDGENYIIVVRGIIVEGSNPFLLSFMCDSAIDIPQMNRLATYIACHAKTAKAEMATFINYDPLENGLCVDLQRLNNWVKNICGNSANDILDLVNRETLQINARRDTIALLMVPNGVDIPYALTTINLRKKPDQAICELMVLPKDDSNEGQRRYEWWKEKQMQTQNSNKKHLLKKIIIGAFVLGALAALLYRCTKEDSDVIDDRIKLETNDSILLQDNCKEDKDLIDDRKSKTEAHESDIQQERYIEEGNDLTDDRKTHLKAQKYAIYHAARFNSSKKDY